MSLQSELRVLFDKKIIRRSTRLEPDRVDALAVHEAAGAFLLLKGNPAKQFELVQSMRPDTAAALCRWLADPAFWGLVGGITRQ